MTHFGKNDELRKVKISNLTVEQLYNLVVNAVKEASKKPDKELEELMDDE
jgi:DNA-binding protein YbaB